MRKVNPALRLVLGKLSDFESYHGQPTDPDDADDTTYQNTMQNRSPRSVSDHLKSPSLADDDVQDSGNLGSGGLTSGEDDSMNNGLVRRCTHREAPSTEPICSTDGELRKTRSVTFNNKVYVRFILKKEGTASSTPNSPLTRMRKSPLVP